MKREYLEAIIEALGEREPAAVVAVLRETDADDYEVEQIKTAEHECEMFVVRGSLSTEPLWIVDATGGGTTVYSPDCWADAVQDYAQEHGWDADEIPQIATAYDRAGIHSATGMQCEPSQAQRIEADAEQLQCNLWREIRGLSNDEHKPLWGVWTEDFQAALAAFREHGGAMTCGNISSHFPRFYAFHATDIAEMSTASPKECTVRALRRGGFTEEQIKAELADWQE